MDQDHDKENNESLKINNEIKIKKEDIKGDDTKYKRKDFKMTKELNVILLGKAGGGKTQIQSLFSHESNAGTKSEKTKNVCVSNADGKRCVFKILDQPGEFDKVDLDSKLRMGFKMHNSINAIFCVFSANRIEAIDKSIKTDFELIQKLYPQNCFYVFTNCSTKRKQIFITSNEYKDLQLTNDCKQIFIDNPELSQYEDEDEVIQKWAEKKCRIII